MIFRCRRQSYDLADRVLVMGILNVTPDSFSEQGVNYRLDDALASARAMLEAGADILDIGGESTRPGAEPVAIDEESRRVVPLIERLRRETDVPISIDTWKAAVAREAIAAGADIINDISGFRRDPELKTVAAEAQAGAIMMHMRGTPQTMQQLCQYDDLLTEIADYFRGGLSMLVKAGIPAERIALDPGIGFSKTAEQNLTLIRHLDAFADLGRPILLGPSRKSFIGKVLGIDEPARRVWGTAAAVACGILQGARIVRVHDVAEIRQAADLAMAIATAS